jgi:hypothetical protein
MVEIQRRLTSRRRMVEIKRRNNFKNPLSGGDFTRGPAGPQVLPFCSLLNRFFFYRAQLPLTNFTKAMPRICTLITSIKSVLSLHFTFFQQPGCKLLHHLNQTGLSHSFTLPSDSAAILSPMHTITASWKYKDTQRVVKT